MSYIDYYLKFDDEAQFKTFHDPENDLVLNIPAIDVIGPVYVPTGNMLTDDEGNEYQGKEPAEGYYVNIRSKTDLPIEIQSFTYTPAEDFPIRRWASNSAAVKPDLTLKVPKGDIMAMLSVDSLAAVIEWMRAEADKYALAFHEYYLAHDQFRVKDAVFLGFIDLLFSLGHITESEKNAIHAI